MNNGFSTINCQQSCQRPTEIFLFSKYHCTTLTVELGLDVSVCAQLKILATKTASHGLGTGHYYTRTRAEGNIILSPKNS